MKLSLRTFRWLLLIFCSWFTWIPLAHALTEQTLVIQGHKISVEIADNEAAREQGLMFRKHLDDNHGMLFVFQESEYIAMWMVNTYIPLSVAFINEKGVIINIENMAPMTNDLHYSKDKALFSLEMNAGWFKKRGVKAGDTVQGLVRYTRTKRE